MRLPFLKSKDSEHKSKKLWGVSKRDIDALWQQIRELRQRCATHDSSLTAIRRDINRIDKKVYQDGNRELSAALEDKSLSPDNWWEKV